PALRERPGCAAAPCAVIADGIDLAEADAGLAAGRDDARRRLGLFATDLAIVHVGPLDAEAGVAHLLAAFHALLRETPTARLLVAGDGPARPALEAAAAALRLGPFARFLGTLPSPWPLLGATDVFVLPGVRRGVPLALLQAMAAGLSIVAADGGGAPEVAGAGRGALLVQPGDSGALARAIADLAGSTARRRELGALARDRVATGYRIERSAAALQALYAEALGGPASGG
ncbi:MAG TPA: glycosyltransferase family 4 protein, partial [bacterium]